LLAPVDLVAHLPDPDPQLGGVWQRYRLPLRVANARSPSVV
jgi:hypothetical protein